MLNIEKDKKDFKKHGMVGPKSRLNYPVNGCLKFKCKNKNKKCDDCIAYSLLEEL